MYQFCVSGASKGESVEEGRKLAALAGEHLAKKGHTLLTGADIGLPNYAAEAYKRSGGKMSLGLSPAISKAEHVVKYRLPTKAYDTILYTGLHYVGRDTLLVASADAVISIGGRMGTLHEFTIAMETETPIGILHGAGGVGDEIQALMEMAKPNKDVRLVVYSSSVEDLVEQLTKILDKEYAKYQNLY